MTGSTTAPANQESSGPTRPATGHARVDRMLQGMLGSGYLEAATLEGAVISLRFRTDDSYFVSDEFLARLTIGAAFGLLYRCGLERATFEFHRDGQGARLRVDRSGFAEFFGLTPDQMAEVAGSPDRFEASPVRTVTEARQWEFYLRFSKEEG